MPPDPELERNKAISSSDDAIDMIEKAGMKAHLYLPAVGHRDNHQLAQALDKLVHLGYIVTDANGDLVGKVATDRPDSEETAHLRRAQLKLIR